MKALKRKDYEARLKPLQLELAAMARWASPVSYTHLDVYKRQN